MFIKPVLVLSDVLKVRLNIILGYILDILITHQIGANLPVLNTYTIDVLLLLLTLTSKQLV